LIFPTVAFSAFFSVSLVALAKDPAEKGLSRIIPDTFNATAEHGRSKVAIFITQGRFTRDYIKGGLAKPEDQQAAISSLCEQVGGKLLNLYFTLGQYDFVVISEMPDAQAVSVLAFVATGGGGIENSVTTQAFTTAEAKALFERAGEIAGSYKPMGAS
jgi:uncharacterized protein with GYD domain